VTVAVVTLAIALAGAIAAIISLGLALRTAFRNVSVADTDALAAHRSALEAGIERDEALAVAAKCVEDLRIADEIAIGAINASVVSAERMTDAIKTAVSTATGDGLLSLGDGVFGRTIDTGPAAVGAATAANRDRRDQPDQVPAAEDAGGSGDRGTTDTGGRRGPRP